MSSAPPIDDKIHWFLQVVMKGLLNDPNYLKNSGYPPEIEQFLSGRVGRIDIEEVDLTELDMPAEIQALFLDLKQQRNTFSASDSAEKIAYFRIATSLLDKLVSLGERAVNVRQVGQFMNEVLAMLEEHLEPSEIGKFREKLESKQK